MAASNSLDFIQTVPRVATLIYQTHQLWQEFQDVPGEIVSLVEHLKALEPVFREIEAHFSQESVSATFKNSLDISRRAHSSLASLVDEMRKQLHSKGKFKRKCAAVKILLHKSVLERLEQGLSRCLTLLQIAIQTYQMAVIARFSPDTIARRVTSELHVLVQQPVGLQTQPHPTQPQPQPQPQLKRPQPQPKRPRPQPQPQPKQPRPEYEKRTLVATERRIFPKPTMRTECCMPSKYGRFALAYAKSSGAWQARFQLPSWLSTSVYEILSTPAIAGWTYTIRTYNIISSGAEIITRVNKGDVAGVLELFHTRKASPFDKSPDGRSLLHHAADRQQYDICQLLLQMGLECLLDDHSTHHGSPLSRIAFSVAMHSVKFGKETAHVSKRIAELFASFLREPDVVPADRLLDFVHESFPDDRFIKYFKRLFMPKYYDRPLRDRLEAVRLGAFNVLIYNTFEILLTQDATVTGTQVSQSSREGLSLMHSAAVAFGCRYPEDLLSHRKPEHYWRCVYDEGGVDVYVVGVASVAQPEDLHCIELIVPWDFNEVPAWRGTPLTSVIGGALCYLSPGIPFNHWDALLHHCLRHWLHLLDAAGVDLLQYGKREASILHDPHDNTKGAFDADAIDRSRRIPRRQGGYSGDPMTRLSLPKFFPRKGDQYWMPIRIIDLKIGSCPRDWQIIWVFEFEVWARQFWELIEEENRMMPGAWVE